MRGWLALNAFLIVLALIGAGTFFVLFTLARAVQLPPDGERFLGAAAALLAVFVMGFAARWFIQFLERRYRGVRS